MNELNYAKTFQEDPIHDYLEKRLENQIKLHSNKSNWNYSWFKILGALELLIASLIPVLVSYITDSTTSLKIFTGVLALLVVVVSGILSLYRFQENWLKHRYISRSLEKEKHLFLSNGWPYNQTERALSTLVERAEAIILEEVVDQPTKLAVKY